MTNYNKERTAYAVKVGNDYAITSYGKNDTERKAFGWRSSANFYAEPDWTKDEEDAEREELIKSIESNRRIAKRHKLAMKTLARKGTKKYWTPSGEAVWVANLSGEDYLTMCGLEMPHNNDYREYLNRKKECDKFLSFFYRTKCLYKYRGYYWHSYRGGRPDTGIGQSHGVEVESSYILRPSNFPKD